MLVEHIIERKERVEMCSHLFVICEYCFDKQHQVSTPNALYQHFCPEHDPEIETIRSECQHQYRQVLLRCPRLGREMICACIANNTSSVALTRHPSHRTWIPTGIENEGPARNCKPCFFLKDLPCLSISSFNKARFASTNLPNADSFARACLKRHT